MLLDAKAYFECISKHVTGITAMLYSLQGLHVIFPTLICCFAPSQHCVCCRLVSCQLACNKQLIILIILRFSTHTSCLCGNNTYPQVYQYRYGATEQTNCDTICRCRTTALPSFLTGSVTRPSWREPSSSAAKMASCR